MRRSSSPEEGQRLIPCRSCAGRRHAAATRLPPASSSWRPDAWRPASHRPLSAGVRRPKQRGAVEQCGDPSLTASRPTPRQTRTNQVHYPADPGQSA
jgi:hypothetical protein